MATMVERETQQPEGQDAGPAARGAARPNRRRLVLYVVGVFVLLLLGSGVRRYIYNLSHVETDDAQVDGDIIPISPKVGGFVAAVHVDDNTPVRAGDPLVELDPRDFQTHLQQTEADLQAALANVTSPARVGQAEAAVAQAEANAEKAHADLDRLRPLAAQNIVSPQQLDAAQAAARSADAALAAAQAALAGADARVAAARAARDQAALNLSYTRVTAPAAGVVSKKSVEVGQLVQPGQPLMALVPLDSVWVTANLKETQMKDVTTGDPVDVTVDAYPGVHYAGHVESISPATGAKFSLLPPDNATGNFTKVVQRVPVRIALDRPNGGARPLRPGMSVYVTIKTK